MQNRSWPWQRDLPTLCWYPNHLPIRKAAVFITNWIQNTRILRSKDGVVPRKMAAFKYPEPVQSEMTYNLLDGGKWQGWVVQGCFSATT